MQKRRRKHDNKLKEGRKVRKEMEGDRAEKFKLFNLKQ